MHDVVKVKTFQSYWDRRTFKPWTPAAHKDPLNQKPLYFINSEYKNDQNCQLTNQVRREPHHIVKIVNPLEQT